MIYFKRHKYQLICNAPVSAESEESNKLIFFGCDYPNDNPDSVIIAAMGNEIVCSEYNGTDEYLRELCHSANMHEKYLRYDRLPKDEQEKRYNEDEDRIIRNIESSINNGGKLLSIQYANQTIEIATITDNRIDNLYSKPAFKDDLFVHCMFRYAMSYGKQKMYIDVPKTNRSLTRICREFELTEKQEEFEEITRFTFLTEPVSK